SRSALLFTGAICHSGAARAHRRHGCQLQRRLVGFAAMTTARILGVLLLAGGATLATLSGLEGGALASKNATGKPALKAGDPEAIWIWFDNSGWHLRGSTGKGKHTFTGYLRATGGMTGVKPTRSGLMRKTELESDGVRFEFELGGGPNGAV